MGTYYSAYVGCYLKLPVTNKPVTEEYYQKPSGERADTRFNPETGEEYELTTRIVNEKESPSAYIEDRQDLDDNKFFEPACAGVDTDKEVIFIPNRGGENLIKGDNSYDFEFSLENIIPQLEILRFKRRYSKYLDYYTEKYGKFEVRFGVVRYGN